MNASADPADSADATQEPDAEVFALTQEDSREHDRSRRSDKTKKILVDAERRDEEATARDAVSDERERAADRRAFTNPDGVYTGHGARRAAAFDRANSKDDRESSADDRVKLTEGDANEVNDLEPDVGLPDLPK
ncbi:hypothetical protein [Arthrobacter sp. H20]|uniref:hypothetical protein n=1 Tax=Arthrobacter sp. H20 TaxID=1267981 RepID=UPI00047E921C|nr:hypothetical protein [Arthrobacter sp. H20]